MNHIKLYGAITAGLLAMGSITHAADYESGVVTEGPESSYTHVEFGSGWYLRGDISWNMHGEYGTESRFISALGVTAESEYSDAFAIRAGFGYRFNSALRMDFTAEQMLDSEFSGARVVNLDGDFVDPVTSAVTAVNDIYGVESISSDYSAANFMLNAYYDLPEMGRFTPYVGGGLGISRIRFSERRTLTCIPTPDEVCGPPAAGAQGITVADVVILDDEDINYTVAYQFALGTMYRLNENLSLDFGYNYFATGSGAKLEYSDGTGIEVDGLSVHKVTAGLIYEIW